MTGNHAPVTINPAPSRLAAVPLRPGGVASASSPPGPDWSEPSSPARRVSPAAPAARTMSDAPGVPEDVYSLLAGEGRREGFLPGGRAEGRPRGADRGGCDGPGEPEHAGAAAPEAAASAGAGRSLPVHRFRGSLAPIPPVPPPWLLPPPVPVRGQPQRSGSLPCREEGAGRSTLPAGRPQPPSAPGSRHRPLSGRVRGLRGPGRGGVFGGSRGHACGAGGRRDIRGKSLPSGCAGRADCPHQRKKSNQLPRCTAEERTKGLLNCWGVVVSVIHL